MKEEKDNANSVSRRQFLKSATVASAFIIVPRFVLGGKGYTAPSDLITLGHIGTGKQAFGLKDSFLKTNEVKIIAASDVYDSKLQRFASDVNQFYATQASQSKATVCTTHADFRDLLARKDIDAVIIATPDHWHSNHAILAARAGKDIYCEKPLSLTIKEGRAMVTEARKHKRVFQTGSMQRSWPEFRQAVELVRNGYIGDIKTVKVNVGPPPVPYNLPGEQMPADLKWDFWLGPNVVSSVYNHNLAPGLTDDFWAHWRDYKEFGGGGMTDWGAHMFDIAQWGLDMDASGPVSVTPPDKDHQFLTYQYANGITMTHEPQGNQGLTFVGTKGEVHVERGKLETNPASLKDQVIGENEKHVYHSEDHYKDFLQAIRKRTKPVADVEIGHRTASVCNIGNIAYEVKKPLKWDPHKEEFDDADANKLRSRDMKKEWTI